MRKFIISVAAALLMAGNLSTMVKAAEKVSIPFGAFWVQTGVFKSFGVNSKAVYEAFVEELHANGGIKLNDRFIMENRIVAGRVYYLPFAILVVVYSFLQQAVNFVLYLFPLSIIINYNILIFIG